jgi:hypothetical protein
LFKTILHATIQKLSAIINTDKLILNANNHDLEELSEIITDCADDIVGTWFTGINQKVRMVVVINDLIFDNTTFKVKINEIVDIGGTIFLNDKFMMVKLHDYTCWYGHTFEEF